MTYNLFTILLQYVVSILVGQFAVNILYCLIIDKYTFDILPILRWRIVYT